VLKCIFPVSSGSLVGQLCFDVRQTIAQCQGDANQSSSSLDIAATSQTFGLTHSCIVIPTGSLRKLQRKLIGSGVSAYCASKRIFYRLRRPWRGNLQRLDHISLITGSVTAINMSEAAVHNRPCSK